MGIAENIFNGGVESKANTGFGNAAEEGGSEAAVEREKAGFGDGVANATGNGSVGGWGFELEFGLCWWCVCECVCECE